MSTTKYHCSTSSWSTHTVRPRLPQLRQTVRFIRSDDTGIDLHLYRDVSTLQQPLLKNNTSLTNIPIASEDNGDFHRRLYNFHYRLTTAISQLADLSLSPLPRRQPSTVTYHHKQHNRGSQTSSQPKDRNHGRRYGQPIDVDPKVRQQSTSSSTPAAHP